MDLKNINELKNLLKKSKSGFPIIISGIEKTLIKESIQQVYNTVEILPELNISILEDDFINYDEVVNACEALPVISSSRIVHIKNPVFLKKAENTGGSDDKSFSGSNNLLSYLSNYIKAVPLDIILLISLNEELEGKNKIVTELKASGYNLEFKMLKGEELHNYVTLLFETNGKKINKSELLYFISAVSGSFDLIEREIEKLCAYADKEEFITKKHIDDAVHRGIENNIFKMVDSISVKNADTAISILDALLFQKEEPLRILGMIIRQYRIIYLIYLMINETKTLDEIKSKLRAQKINLMDFVLNNYVKQAKNFDGAGLKKSLTYCSEADYAIKTSGLSDELILETLIVKLCK